MPDMLCPLVRLPKIEPVLQRLKADGIIIRRPNPWEQEPVRDFIVKHFTRGWADETAVAFAHQPISCFAAYDGDKIVGFASYECTRKNFFGPTGVDEAYRGKGIGVALFLASLYGLRDMGYVYCIIGDAGPVDFYRKKAGAMVIPIDDGRGIYGLGEEPCFLNCD